VSASAKKWASRLLKLAFCGGALWYLWGKVTLNDSVRLAESPGRIYVLLAEEGEALRIRDRETGEERSVPRFAVAGRGQLEKGRRGIEPGLRSIIRSIDRSWATWAFLVYGPVVFGIAWRLQCLLAAQEIRISYRDAILLTFAGNFFNFAMPGTTGGDLYKAYHITRLTSKRTEGVTIVFLDRALGLASFLGLAAVTILVSLRRPMIGDYGRWVGYLMAVLLVSGMAFFSRRLRAWIGYDRLLARLPFADKVKRIDETTFSFRHHRGPAVFSFVITVATHFLIVTCIYFMGRGLGIHPQAGQSAGDLYIAVLLATVVGYLFAAVPITIQGFGLLEAVFIRVLVGGGWCNESQMLALTLSARFIQMVWSLPGVVVPWLGFGRPPQTCPDGQSPRPGGGVQIQSMEADEGGGR
jgi:uncharacterized membrane protein YbhN (UPF0104 family)